MPTVNPLVKMTMKPVRAEHERFSQAGGNPSLRSPGLTRAASPGLLAAVTYA